MDRQMRRQQEYVRRCRQKIEEQRRKVSVFSSLNPTSVSQLSNAVLAANVWQNS